jgi:hypothetical protein
MRVARARQVQAGLGARDCCSRPGFVAATSLSAAAAAPYLLASRQEAGIRAAGAKDTRWQGRRVSGRVAVTAGGGSERVRAGASAVSAAADDAGLGGVRARGCASVRVRIDVCVVDVRG